MSKYVIGKPIWDSDMEMYYVHVGLDNKEKTLLYSAWGKDRTVVQMMAAGLVSLIEIKEMT